MADKRSYSDIVIAVETSLDFIKDDLSEIKGHLKELNASQSKQDIRISTNKAHIGLIFKIGGSILTVIIALTAVALGVLDFFGK